MAINLAIKSHFFMVKSHENHIFDGEFPIIFPLTLHFFQHEIPRHKPFFSKNPNPPMFQSSNQSNPPAKSGEIAIFPPKIPAFPRRQLYRPGFGRRSAGRNLLLDSTRCAGPGGGGDSAAIGKKLQGVHEDFMGISWRFLGILWGFHGTL